MARFSGLQSGRIRWRVAFGYFLLTRVAVPRHSRRVDAAVTTDPPEEQQVIWLVQPSEQSYVRQENRLVHARYSLSPRELKLVLYACAMIDPQAEDFGKCYIR